MSVEPADFPQEGDAPAPIEPADHREADPREEGDAPQDPLGTAGAGEAPEESGIPQDTPDLTDSDPSSNGSALLPGIPAVPDDRAAPRRTGPADVEGAGRGHRRRDGAGALPLGIGLVLVGLGIGLLGLRLRRA